MCGRFYVDEEVWREIYRIAELQEQCGGKKMGAADSISQFQRSDYP